MVDALEDMYSRKLINIAAFFVLILITGCPDTVPVLHGDLSILVIDRNNNAGIEGALVSISNAVDNFRKTTDASGLALFRNLIPGEYDITVTNAAYYDTQSKTRVISGTINAPYPIIMDGKPILGTSHDEINFTTEQDTAQLVLTNIGTGQLTYSIYPNEDFIDLHPKAGQLTDDYAEIIIALDRSKIPSSTYTIITKITIQSEEQDHDLGETNIPVYINTLMDIDSNYYTITTITNSHTNTVFTWMAENLRVSRTPDGTGYLTSAVVGDTWPSSDTSLLDSLGRYYSWKEASNHENLPQGICPDGWHIPDTTEIELSFRGIHPKHLYIGGGTGLDKALDGLYLAYNIPINDIEPGTFHDGTYGDFWTSNENIAFQLWFFYGNYIIYYLYGDIAWGEDIDYIWVPVRCIRDTPLIDD